MSPIPTSSSPSSALATWLPPGLLLSLAATYVWQYQQAAQPALLLVGGGYLLLALLGLGLSRLQSRGGWHDMLLLGLTPLGISVSALLITPNTSAPFWLIIGLGAAFAGGHWYHQPGVRVASAGGAVLLGLLGAQSGLIGGITVQPPTAFIDTVLALISLLWAAALLWDVRAGETTTAAGAAAGAALMLGTSLILFPLRGQAGLNDPLLLLLLFLLGCGGWGWGQWQHRQRVRRIEALLPLEPAAPPATNLTTVLLTLSDHLQNQRQARQETKIAHEALQSQLTSLQQNHAEYETTLESLGNHLHQVLTREATTNLNETDINLQVLPSTLSTALQSLLTQLSTSQTQLHTLITQVGQVTDQILIANANQIHNANEQAGAIAQVSATIDEFEVLAGRFSAQAGDVVNQVQGTRSIAEAGQDAVRAALESITHIEARVNTIAERIDSLQAQTRQIGDITATVNSLATQSTLLAFNAAIEATHAGEAGKGFAVVATEIRNLAQQSKQATNQIKGILDDILQAAQAAETATREGNDQVSSGVELTQQAGSTITHLNARVGQNADIAQQIVAGVSQQTVGLNQISTAMENIHQAAQQSENAARQTQRAIHELSNLLESLGETGSLNRESESQ